VFLAEAGRVVEVDEAGSMVTTTRGYMLPLAVDQSTCGTPAAEATAAMALVGWLAGHVAALECIERR
jgi:hypothetical protein